MNLDVISQVFSFFGGLGLFLFGMHIMSVGLQKAAGNRMKQLLAVLTKNKFFGVMVGALVTAVIQSSSATTVMVVGFVNAGIMSLTQTVGVIMGANIGTTITAWVLASVEWFKIFSPVFFAPLAIAVGVVFVLFSSRERIKHIGEIVVGFGVLFLGMSTMSGVIGQYSDSELFRNIFIKMGENPALAVIAGAIVTAVLQSSSASVAVLQSVALTGFLPFSAAIFIIMGQNIGTCVTALISGIGTTRNAKAASYVHLLFNITGSLIFILIALVYFNLFNRALAMSNITATGISIAHTLFNVLSMALLYNFSDILVKIAKKIAWFRVPETDETVPVHLDERILETPYFALQNAAKEIDRLGQMVLTSFKTATESLIDKNAEKVEAVLAREANIDNLTQLISSYLVKLSSRELNREESATITSFINIINNLERVGDHCENIAELTQFAVAENINLSEMASAELSEIINATVICFESAVGAFRDNDFTAASRIAAQEDIIDALEQRFREGHIDRLKSGSCSPASGVFFLDAMTNLERIGDHALNIGEIVMDEYERYHRHRKHT